MHILNIRKYTCFSVRSKLQQYYVPSTQHNTSTQLSYDIRIHKFSKESFIACSLSTPPTYLYGRFVLICMSSCKLSRHPSDDDVAMHI